MPRRDGVTRLCAAMGLLLLSAAPALALISKPLPLRLLLEDSTFIVSATIQSVDADKPAMVLAVDEYLKGKSTLRQLAVLFKPDSEAKKKDHVSLILKRIAPKLPLVLFVLHNGKQYTAFAYSNGTWFQLLGVEDDDAIRWRFTHGEPNLRKTYKGSTAELKRIVVDGLSGKKAPPKLDSKVKPGFGPEVKKKSESRAPAPLTPNPSPPEYRGRGEKDGSPLPRSGGEGLGVRGDRLFAVIPQILVGGPLAILAMLFPAVFGGLILVLRRWTAALSALSLSSTLYTLYYFCGRWLAASWWGTPLALWLLVIVVNLLGLLWAWRRHVASLGEGMASKAKTGRGELIVLGVLSMLCLGMVIFLLPHSLIRLDMGGKLLWMFAAGLWTATLHALAKRWTATRGAAQRGLPSEGVLLWTMLLTGAGFGVTLGHESSAAGLSEDKNDPSLIGQRYRVAWRFRPPVERCWMASSPVVDGERVYIGVVFPSAFNSSGAVYCVDRNSGKEIWMFNDGGTMKDVFSSPCLADGRLYIGEGFHQHADCKLYCLDAASGKKQWDFTTASHTESSPCVRDGKVYFGAGDDGLYCLDAANGKEKWHLKGLHVDANPLVIDNRLYGGSGIGDAYKGTVLFCVNADNGEMKWRMPVDLPVWGMPAVRGEYVYAGIGNGNFLESADKPAGAVLCLERASGKRVWRYDVGDGVHVRVCVDAESVYFASRDRHCYCLDRWKGTQRWKVDLGSPILASPFLVEGERDTAALYVAGCEGLLSRLDAATGKIAWTFDVAKDTGQGAMMFSSPLVQADSKGRSQSRPIWFGCGLNDFTRGILYCLEERFAEQSD